MANFVLRSSMIYWGAATRPHSHLAIEFTAARKFLTKESVSELKNHRLPIVSGGRLLHSLSHRCLAFGSETKAPVVITTPRMNAHILSVSPSLSWSVIRTYAKKGKDKGGKPPKKVVLTSAQLEGLVDMDKVQQDMDHVVDDLKDKFIHQVNVRTSQGIFDNLNIKTPDGNYPLIQLGQVIQKSPQLIVLNMVAAPQYIGNVKEALENSGLNINPQQDGTSLFLPLPKVTREHRETLAKNAKTLSEKSKKQLREIYSRSSKKIKSSKEGHSSDDIISAVGMVEDVMHNKIKQVDTMTGMKQKELMGTK